jgi:hypothetical protein
MLACALEVSRPNRLHDKTLCAQCVDCHSHRSYDLGIDDAQPRIFFQITDPHPAQVFFFRRKYWNRCRRSISIIRARDATEHQLQVFGPSCHRPDHPK